MFSHARLRRDKENTQAWPLICCQRCSTIFHPENEVNFEHKRDMFSKKPTILDVQVPVLLIKGRSDLVNVSYLTQWLKKKKK